MKNYFHIVLFLSLTSCVHEYELKPIDPYSIFHSNSSKVWLINHLYKNGKDFSPLSIPYKEMVIFHKTNTCYFHKVKQFHNNNSKKADFSLDGTKKEIKFSFKNDIWIYKIASYSIDKIILKPIKAENLNYTVELIPFPEY